MQVRVLGSGSRGNALVVDGPDGGLLLDCGFARKHLDARLAASGYDAGRLRGILVTHEHADHASGVGRAARAYGLPVYATHGTARRARFGDGVRLHTIRPGQTLRLAGLEVQAYAVPHDAAEPVQFVLGDGQSRLGVLSDAGHVTAHMRSVLEGCHTLLLEANHCPQMLAAGPYPPALQRRVGGRYGHLANAQAAGLLAALDLAGTRRIVLTHLSEQNNTPDRAREAVGVALRDWGGLLCTAAQDTPLDAFEV